MQFLNMIAFAVYIPVVNNKPYDRIRQVRFQAMFVCILMMRLAIFVKYLTLIEDFRIIIKTAL